MCAERGVKAGGRVVAAHVEALHVGWSSERRQFGLREEWLGGGVVCAGLTMGFVEQNPIVP